MLRSAAFDAAETALSLPESPPDAWSPRGSSPLGDPRFAQSLASLDGAPPASPYAGSDEAAPGLPPGRWVGTSGGLASLQTPAYLWSTRKELDAWRRTGGAPPKASPRARGRKAMATR